MTEPPTRLNRDELAALKLAAHRQLARWNKHRDSPRPAHASNAQRSCARCASSKTKRSRTASSYARPAAKASRLRGRTGGAQRYCRHMDTQVTKDSSTGNVAAIVAALVLPFAIYLAFWRINWHHNGEGDSLLPYIMPFVFCVIVSSAIGSIIARIVKATRS